MANNIDLTKSLPHSACEPCSIDNFQAKLYYNKIEPGLKLPNLINDDVTGLFIEGLYKAIHFVTFLYNATKRSEVVLFIRKNEVLPAFKRYCLYHKKRDKHVRRSHTNEGG